MYSFNYIEWQYALKEGDNKRAEVFKKLYNEEVLKRLKRTYNQYFEELKQFPIIILN